MTTRPRLRDLGIAIGRHATGPLNAITDVAGVRVGHSTIVEGDRIRTGATAILPHGENLFRNKTPAALAVLNGFGKLVGATQIRELGEIESPILLTNTLATGRAIEAALNWTLSQPGNERVTSVNAVVGETNDSRLNDIRAGRPTVEEIAAALDAAAAGPVREGAVGAGTGTVAFGLKGGIGTSSRVVEGWTLGVLVQSNFGGLLKIDGRPVASDPKHDRDGSIMIVVATDAPLSDRNLRRLAFSTAEGVRRTPERRATLTAWPELSNDAMSPLFEAAIEATEEAILHSLLAATTTTGWNTAEARAVTIPALPVPLPFLQS